MDLSTCQHNRDSHTKSLCESVVACLEKVIHIFLTRYLSLTCVFNVGVEWGSVKPSVVFNFLKIVIGLFVDSYQHKFF